MNSLPIEEEFQNYADTLMLDHFFDPFTSVLDFVYMSEEKKDSGLSVMTDLTGAGKAMEGAATLTKEMREFLGSIFSPLFTPVLSETGEWLADLVRIRRLKSQQILEKARIKAERDNLEIKAGNPQILVPILEYGSLEGDESMQDLWSNLLLSEVTEGKVHPCIPEILKQISGTEAKLLSLMFESKKEHEKLKALNQNRNRIYIDSGFSCANLREKISFSNEMIDNLIRLNLCQSEHDYGVKNSEIKHIKQSISQLSGLRGLRGNLEHLLYILGEALPKIELAIYSPNGQYKQIDLTNLGELCVKTWSYLPSDTSPQTSAS